MRMKTRQRGAAGRGHVLDFQTEEPEYPASV
jgi:hypothetical protein